MSKPIAVIPAYSHVDRRLTDALKRTGMPAIYVHGCSDLVKARCRLLTDALATSADSFVFIDADMTPSSEQIVELAESERLDDDNALTGAYVVGGDRIAAIAMNGAAFELPTPERYVRCLVAGMGFAAVTRRAVERLRAALPTVLDREGCRWHPYFLPLLVEHDSEEGTIAEYLSEDYAFWYRLRAMAGVELWLDSNLSIGHCKATVLYPVVNGHGVSASTKVE
jgi:hypothetical protein